MPPCLVAHPVVTGVACATKTVLNADGLRHVPLTMLRSMSQCVVTPLIVAQCPGFQTCPGAAPALHIMYVSPI